MSPKARLKTAPTRASVKAFIDAVEDPERRKDCRAVMKMMREASGAAPRMWGGSIVGYGDWHYKYASGREGDWFLVGFSPRKQDLTLYVLDESPETEKLLEKLGRHKRGKGCLYVKRLSDLDLGILRRIILRAVKRKRSS